MAPQSKTALLQPSFIDLIISDEILLNRNPSLSQVVLKHNMHSPCGAFDPSAVCIDDRICKKRSPKQFVEETVHENAQIYINYRQKARDDGDGTAPWTYRAPKEGTTTRIIDK